MVGAAFLPMKNPINPIREMKMITFFLSSERFISEIMFSSRVSIEREFPVLVFSRIIILKGPLVISSVSPELSVAYAFMKI